MRRTFLLFMVSLAMAGYLFADDLASLPLLKPSLQQSLSEYLMANYKSPEEYVIQTFEDHDVVFLGEFHRIRQCVELVHNLIPALYENGVYHLGTEFACFEDQALIDRLLSADSFDLDLAYRIQFNQWPYMGYKEYIDIYRVAWELNSGLPEGFRPFRIIGLNAKADFSLLQTAADIKDPVVMRKVRKAGPRDSVMAAVVMQEVVDSGEKILVFCGFGHGFTKFRWPKEGPRKCSAFTDEIGTAGNRIYEAIGQRSMFIFIHAPWFFNENEGGRLVYPADGLIDTLMLSMEPEFRRVGFDVALTPFANLPGDNSYWSDYYENFTLDDICDGYIYLGPLSSYEGVTVAEGFITEQNRTTVIMQGGNPKARDTSRTVDDIVASMEKSANIKYRFRMFR